MPFPDLRENIDARLDADPQLAESQRTSSTGESTWTLDGQTVTIRPAGSTGIELIYQTDGRVIHRRTFAASPMSIPRIVRTITEHLMGYRVPHPQET
jgi:hypothetical protein